MNLRKSEDNKEKSSFFQVVSTHGCGKGYTSLSLASTDYVLSISSDQYQASYFNKLFMGQ